jgi:hypothetical protein
MCMCMECNAMQCNADSPCVLSCVCVFVRACVRALSGVLNLRMQIEVYCCWFVVSLCCEKNHLKQSVAPGQFSRCAKQVWPKIALEKIGGSEERRMKGFSYSVHAWYYCTSTVFENSFLGAAP